MSQQGLRQASVRAVTGTSLDYNGDFSALFTLKGIAAGDFNGRFLAWLNFWLSASYDNLPGAMAAFATANNATNFGAVGTFDAGAGGGGGGYVAKAVHFDGSAWLTIDSLSSTDNGLISLVFWSKLPSLDDGFGHDLTIIYTDPEDNSFNYFQTLHDTNSWDFSFSQEAGGFGESNKLAANCNIVDVWSCVIFTVDTNHDSGERVYKTYVNDVSIDDIGEGSPDPAFVPTFNGFPLFIGGDGSIQIVGDFADLRIMVGTSLLTDGDIPEATRRLFIDADGKPVDPATATATLGTPCVLLSGDASGFAINQGNGGSFMLSGSLTDASSSPSD